MNTYINSQQLVYHTIYYIGGCIFDLPYGVTNESWDTVLSDVKLDRIFKQFIAQNSSTTSFFFAWHTPTMSQQVAAIMGQNGFQESQNLFWHKSGHYTQSPATSYTSSVEMGTLGFKPHRTKVPFNMPTEPRQRHNFIEWPAVTTYEKDEDGNRVNPCQKPAGLSKWIVGNHCPPGSTVLIIGAGAGGDIKGALEADVNVVAVESDPRQFQLLHKIAQEWNYAEETAIRRAAEISLSSSQSTSTGGSSSSSSSVRKTGTDKNSSATVFTSCPCCGSEIQSGDITYACEDTDCIDAGLKFHEACTIEEEGKRVCLDHQKK